MTPAGFARSPDGGLRVLRVHEAGNLDDLFKARVGRFYERAAGGLAWMSLAGLVAGGAWFLHEYTVMLWLDGPWTLGLAGGSLVFVGAIGLRVLQLIHGQRRAPARIGCFA